MQRSATLLVPILLAASGAGAQVHRCTTPDGRVVYSDTACPASATDAKTLVKPPESLSGPRGKRELSPPGRVEFSGNDELDYIKASAILDSIRVSGRDCEWALKVDEKKINDCVVFMGKLQPGGEYEQTMARVSELSQGSNQASSATVELRRIVRSAQEIVRYKEFMLARLGVNAR